MSKAVYAGSFDPITLGHMDIIARASKMFDEVYVVIMRNSAKNSLFSEEERKQCIDAAISEVGLTNVYCEIGDGLTVDYAEKKGANVLIRGLRATMDFEYELQIANVNNYIAKHIETVFIAAKPGLSYISSSVVKDVAKYHGDLKGLVPSSVIPLLEKKYIDFKD